MPINRKSYISIRCDICDAGEDLLDGYSVQETWLAFKEIGWTGTIRKCYCPECSRRRKEKAKHVG